LVRAPKIYVRDCGLVHALLEVETLDQLLGHPVVGASWEGFVIENLIQAAGPGRTPYYYRTRDGAEIDLMFEQAGAPSVAVEIKRSTAPKIDTGFGIACDDLSIAHRIVIYSGNDSYQARYGARVMPLIAGAQTIAAILRQ
jgi:uncharacterized protein